MKLDIRAATVSLLLAAGGQVCAATNDLNEQAGGNLGFTVSGYKYKETDATFVDAVRIDATKVGVDYSYAYVAATGWVFKADARYANGKTDYRYADQTMDGQTDWYVDIRGLVGKDVEFAAGMIFPYAGLGYRFLTNDARGMITQNGSVGYLRENRLIYVPIGASYRYPLSAGGRLITNGELDLLVRGRQTSYLSDVNSANTDVAQDQASGIGLRASLMYERSSWSVGPWLTYWNIGKSGTVPAVIVTSGGIFNLAWEPKNTTTELGLKVSYRF